MPIHFVCDPVHSVRTIKTNMGWIPSIVPILEFLNVIGKRSHYPKKPICYKHLVKVFKIF